MAAPAPLDVISNIPSIMSLISFCSSISRYMGVLVSERERCERIYYDNPKDWDERKYLNKLKKQRQWTETKATIVAEKLKKKEKENENRFNNDIDLFTNLYYNNHSYT
jgi:hypothetical protein